MYKVNKDYHESLYIFQCTNMVFCIDFVHNLVYNIIVEREDNMSKSKHRKKYAKVKQTGKINSKKATLNDTAFDIIDLYRDYMMTPEYDNIPLTDDLIQVESNADHLISRVQGGTADIDELAFYLDDYFMTMKGAAEERGFVIGYLYAITHAKTVIYDEERGKQDDE